MLQIRWIFKKGGEGRDGEKGKEGGMEEEKEKEKQQ